ncbi:hypothetical protein, partial [Shewanella algae]|uniref:hypothetical protein n=1 Tax=Shewanella algae TaxID=38313 RepID=UPI00313D0E78
MSITRKQFLRTGAFAATGAILSPSLLRAMYASKHITGIQLYSVREDMKKDPLGTLKALRAMGYTYVEH